MIEHVGADVFEARLFQNGLVVKTNVAGVKQRFLFSAHEHARGAERVAGVEEFQRRRGIAAAGFFKRGPVDFAIVFEALEQRRDVIDFVVGEQRVFADAQFVALAGHDVDGIVQDAFDEEITQLGHQHVRLREISQRHRQRADVVVMAMGDGDGIHLLVAHGAVERQAVAAFAFGMHAGIHEQAVAVDFDEPAAGADVGVGIEIGNPHELM